MINNKECYEIIAELKELALEIAKLKKRKDELETNLAKLVGHGETGKKTYSFDDCKAEITSGWNYTVNKEEYEAKLSLISPEFDPIRKNIKYDISSAIIKKIEKYACHQQMMLISSIFSKSPKKIHVKIINGA